MTDTPLCVSSTISKYHLFYLQIHRLLHQSQIQRGIPKLAKLLVVKLVQLAVLKGWTLAFDMINAVESDKGQESQAQSEGQGNTKVDRHFRRIHIELVQNLLS